MYAKMLSLKNHIESPSKTYLILESVYDPGEDVLEVQDRQAEEESNKASVLGDIGHEGVRPDLFRHVHARGEE